jgi:hypothetical protein
MTDQSIAAVIPAILPVAETNANTAEECWQPSLLRPMQRNRAPCPRSPHCRPV